MDVEDDLYIFITHVIENFESIEQYSKKNHFQEVLKVIKKFKNPPAVEYLEKQREIIPDIFIFNTSGTIEVKLNDAYYPDIIDRCIRDEKGNFI